jgi:CBS domain-containing protein
MKLTAGPTTVGLSPAFAVPGALPPGLAPNVALTAGEFCTRSVVHTGRGMLLDAAARLMRTHHVGSLVVVEERFPGERIVVGMITDRDLATAVVALERDPKSFCVGDVMSGDVVTVREQDSLSEVLAVMRRRRVRRVPVTGARGELVGIVSVGDVLGVVTGQLQALAAAVGAAQRQEATAVLRG